MGMGMVYGLATLKVPHMQTKFERLGSCTSQGHE